MLKTVDIEVEDMTITLRALPATDATDVLVRLTKLVGPAVGALMGGADGGDERVLGLLPDAFRSLCDKLDPKEFREIREALLRESTFVADGATGALLARMGQSKLTHFDMLFSGRVPKQFPLLWEALKLNFGFSDAALDAARGAFMAAMKRRSPSPPSSASAGTSIVS